MIMTKNKIKSFTHKAVAFLLLNGVAWIWCSYLLAYLGREDIAETLSKTVVVEILGVFLVYGLKSLFENLSKNNTWPDKKASEEEDTPDDSKTY